jgi:dihydrofolate reductase
MGDIVLYMWTSLDGFIAGPEDGPGQGLGIGGERLHDSLTLDGGDPSTGRSDDEVGATVLAEAMATGAVLTGRRTFELAGQWNGDHHDGVPIIVLTHDVPDEPPPGTVEYATDPTEAADRARAAAGDGDVLVLGAGAAQALLRVGALDEIALHVVPVLLGRGRRLFEGLPAELVELELMRRRETPDTEDLARRVTHLRYRVRRGPREP